MTVPDVSTPRRLLIVDDSRISRMRIRAHFAKYCPDWTIDEAESGDEAVNLAARSVPDYVTMDVNMPGMSGFETAQLLLLQHPQVRIVMLTANIQESSRQLAASMRLQFVAKPVTAASLQQAQDCLLGTA